MSAVSCPYCGASINLPLRFCLTCGRSVSTAEMKKLGGLKTTMRAGVTKRLEDNISSASFDLSKKSYRIQRIVRHILQTAGYVMLMLLLYYVIVVFVWGTSVPDKQVKHQNHPVAPAKVQKQLSPSTHKK